MKPVIEYGWKTEIGVDEVIEQSNYKNINETYFYSWRQGEWNDSVKTSTTVAIFHIKWKNQ